MDDYRDTAYTAFAQGGSYKAFECKWVSFKANTDDFAIALNVDGAVTYIDTLWPNASYFSSTRIVGFKQYIPPDNLSCSFTAGYDKENNCYWLTSAFLEKYGFYDRSTGYGILPIPMSEPDRYPHTYKAELKFKYKNGAGETEMLENSNDIRMYYDAPVLQKWDFDHYTPYGIETSPMHYVTITNRADREGCKQQQSNKKAAAAVAFSFWPPLWPFSRQKVKNLPITGLSAPHSRILRANKKMNGTGIMLPMMAMM